MRKIIVQEMITVDGFFAGAKGEIDWHVVDAEFNDFAIKMLNAADTLLFGHTTYDLMANYWPTPHAATDDPIVAEKMNSLQKIVISKTLQDSQWNNSTILHTINKDEILKMKEAPGKDILIFGSGTIVSALTKLELIDEYRLIVNPVILGEGKSLFGGVHNQPHLRLSKTHTFESGNVLLCYEPR
jgi:dihydrofolate reductase